MTNSHHVGSLDFAMRLLLIDSNHHWGGGQKWCLETARGLSERGHGVTVGCLGGSALHARCTAAGVPVIELPRMAAGGFPAGVSLIRRLRPQRPDLILATLGRDVCAGSLVKWATGAPLVQRRGVARPAWRTRWGRFLTLSAVDMFVANSEAISHALTGASAMDPRRVSVIPNAVDEPPPLDRAACRRELRIRSSEVVVLALGRLVGMKGHAWLLDAWREVERRRPEAVLLLAGSGPALPSLASQVRQLAHPERVRLLGFRTDSWPLLAAADLYVQPSLRNEGTSHALLEALASGRAALVGSCAGLEETIRRCGGGRTVEVGNRSELARTLIEMLESPEELARLGREGRAGVRRHHSTALILNQWELFSRSLPGITTRLNQARS